jgi:hypothetical protein
MTSSAALQSDKMHADSIRHIVHGFVGNAATAADVQHATSLRCSSCPCYIYSTKREYFPLHSSIRRTKKRRDEKQKRRNNTKYIT